jgi:hypothetical protein
MRALRHIEDYMLEFFFLKFQVKCNVKHETNLLIHIILSN